jgi:hypothetical protein
MYAGTEPLLLPLDRGDLRWFDAVRWCGLEVKLVVLCRALVVPWCVDAVDEVSVPVFDTWLLTRCVGDSSDDSAVDVVLKVDACERGETTVSPLAS